MSFLFSVCWVTYQNTPLSYKNWLWNRFFWKELFYNQFLASGKERYSIVDWMIKSLAISILGLCHIWLVHCFNGDKKEWLLRALSTYTIRLVEDNHSWDHSNMVILGRWLTYKILSRKVALSMFLVFSPKVNKDWRFIGVNKDLLFCVFWYYFWRFEMLWNVTFDFNILLTSVDNCFT